MKPRCLLIPVVLLAFVAQTRAALLFDRGADWRWRPGTNEASSPVSGWRTTGFNDSQFTTAPAPFWYGDVLPGGTEITGMQNVYLSIFLRKTFVITNLADIGGLRLGALVDDGFVAWINGTEVQRVNVPGSPGSAVSTNTLADNAAEPVSFISYDLPDPSAYLVSGTNTMAVQVFQSSLGSSDLGFDASLEAILSETNPPTVLSVSPLPAGTVNFLSEITVTFSEPVNGLDFFDLLINGARAMAVTPLSSSSYSFSFPQPAYGMVQISWDAQHGITDQALPPNPFDGSGAGATWSYNLVDNTPPTVASLTPAAGSNVRALTEITVLFSENVTGVDAADLRVNGSAASGILVSGPNLYRFTFTQPVTGLVQVAWLSGHGIADQAAVPNAFAGGNWTYTLDPNAAAGLPYISEFMASNTRILADENNEFSDWIEIYNPSSVPVNLEDWSLTDSMGDLNRWRFPATNLAGGGFLVVFASEKDRRVPGARLHTNFRLAANGEYLALVRPDGAIVSEFKPAYPAQVLDVSYGFAQSGDPPLLIATTNAVYFTRPTPGVANLLAGTNAPGPVIQNVLHMPNVPLDQEDLVVTAEVLPSFFSVADVSMRYRIMFSNEVTTTMFDDGAHGDGAAGDGRYGAIIPANLSTNGQMIRYYISATDVNGRPSRWPLFTDRTNTAQYLGTVVNPNYVTSKLPIIHLFAPANVLQPPGPTATGSIGADSQAGTNGVVVFHDGELYDNVRVEVRGNTTASFNKKSHRFDFTREHPFRHAGGGYGIPDRPAPRVRRTSFVADYGDPSYMRQGLAFWLCDLVGSPGSFYYPVRLQLNGQFYQLANHNDVHTEELLERLDYDPRGALYNAAGTVVSGQFSTGGFDKKSRTQEGNADYTALANSLVETLPIATRATNFFEQFDVPNALNYLVAARWSHENDDVWANMSLYHDNDGDNLWRIIGFDMNLSWGAIFYEGGNPAVIEGVQATNDIHKAHPLYGSSATPALSGPSGANGFNRVYDTVFLSPVLRPMYLRRVRSMLDAFAKPPGTPAADLVMEKKVLEWRDLIAVEARLDRIAWGWPPKGGQCNFDPPPNSGAFGSAARTNAATTALTNGVNAMINDFIVKRRIHFYNKHSVTNTALPIGNAKDRNAGIPLPQPANAFIAAASVEVNPSSGNQDQEYVAFTNLAPFALDVSGWTVEGAVQFTFHPGTVVPSNGVFYLSPNVRAFRARTTAPRGGQGLYVLGPYQGTLSARGETVRVRNAQGLEVNSLTYPANPSPAQQFLRITELMYSPAPLAGNPTDPQEFEYIELKNIGPSMLSLTGVRFTNGVTFNFSGSAVTSLNSGQTVLVVKNAAAFAARYGGGLNVAGQYSGTLDNGGERIRLIDATGEEIHDFDYENDWYPLTDGHGFSLVVVNENADPDDWGRKAQWRASGQLGGSPGFADPGPPAIGPILVNEVLSASVIPQTDTIEFLNTNTGPVNIGGWYISDDFNTPKKYRIPDNTMIPAGNYLTFNESQFNPGGQGFAFSSDSDEAWLFSANAGGDLTGYAHGFRFGAAEASVSFGRYVISTGEEHFVAQSAQTLGSVNAGPKVGPVVINEIMYRPPDVGTNDNSLDEFIELRNISGSGVPLFDPARTTNTWKMTEGVDFDFPTNITLAAGEYVLLLNFDPQANTVALAAFRAKYGVGTGVRVFGPYRGGLNNAGERIELKKPSVPLPDHVPFVLADEVEYSDSAPWPAGADGYGLSLQRKTAAAYGNDPINWTAAAPTAARATSTDETVPSISSHPASQNVLAFSDVTLSVAATGTAPLQYQWRFNGANLPGATGPVLQLNDFAPEQAGSYVVVVHNPSGSAVSSNALVTVTLPASILAQPASAANRVGENAAFTVLAYSPSPLRYQWRFNGSNIQNATNATHNITGVQESNGGNYDVIVTDDIGPIVSQAATLTVLVNPTFLHPVPPLVVNAVAGQDVTLSAAASGTLPMSFRWRRGGTTLTNDYPAFRNSSFLTLRNLQAGNTNITLVVTNPANAGASAQLNQVAYLFVVADTDGDRIPDDWENENGLLANDPSDADDDPDNDTLTNYEEYLAGTDPHDQTSYLKVERIAGGSSATLSFMAVSNRTYTVEYKNNLSAALWQKLADVVAQPVTRLETVMDANPGPNRYYRLTTPRRP